MQEAPRALRDHVDDPLGRGDGRQRGVAAGDPLPHRHEVRRRTVLIDRPPGARETGSAQDLVGHEQHLIAVADLPDRAEILRARRGRPRRGAAHRLRDERGHRVGPRPPDRGLEGGAAAGRARRVRAATFAAVRVRGGNARDVHQPLAERQLVLLARRCRECQQGVAVIGGREGDDAVLPGLAGLDPVLPGELERGLHGLRSAGEEVELVEIARQARRQLAAELPVEDVAVGKTVRRHSSPCLASGQMEPRKATMRGGARRASAMQGIPQGISQPSGRRRSLVEPTTPLRPCMPIWLRLLLAVAALVPSRAFAQTGAAAAGPENLLMDGVPPIPSRIADVARRYGEFRAADFWDWHPTRREMIIATRFGDAPQLHRVAFPGGARTQLTFFPDPVSGASYQPTGGPYIVFTKDVGGAEFLQKYRYDVAT